VLLTTIIPIQIHITFYFRLLTN